MFMTLIAIIVAYLIGSISFSIVLAKMSGRPDPRTEGSQNAGATNTLRTAGKSAAIIVLVGDLVKGAIAVLLGKFLGVTGFGLGLVAVAAVAGHVYPLFFKFRGGKGVATAIGALFGLSLILFLVAIIIFAAITLLTRYASLASLCSVGAATLLSLFAASAYFIPLLIILGLITFKHLPNIQRLKSGQENKVQF
jgi:glycerol-3-phosphate acyltransferase PlsY